MLYSLTTFLITNKRIIYIKEKNLFNYERIEIPLENIEDIDVKINGVLGNILKYGNLIIQSAGREIKMNINYLYKPLKVKDRIVSMKNIYLTKEDKVLDKISLDLLEGEELIYFSDETKK